MANKKEKDGGPVPDGAAEEAASTVTSSDKSAPLRSAMRAKVEENDLAARKSDKVKTESDICNRYTQMLDRRQKNV